MSNLNAWTLAQHSLKFFMVKFLGLQWLPHYDEWEKIATTELRADVQSPRGHGKSTFWSFGLPLWDVIRGKAEVLIVSYSEDQVRALLRKIRVEVETNPKLEPIRPSTKEIWGTDMLSFGDGGVLYGLGFGTSARGRHPKRIVGDDVLKDMGGMGPEDQERAWFGVITGMAMPETKIAVIGTPVDFDDLLMKLENNAVYHHWKKPAINPDGSPLCPQLFTAETLEMRRKEMGSINFAREFLLERIDPSTQPFKNQYQTVYEEAPANFARIVTICDPAYTEDDGDATAIVTVGLTHGNHAYVLEAKQIRKEDPGAIVDALFRTIDAYNPSAVGIEKRKGQALQYSFEERRTRENRWDFQYVELTHGSKSKDDMSRIGGLVPRWEARSIHVHKNQNELLRQLYQFRFDDKSKGHDDLIDALAYVFSPDLSRPNTGKVFVPQATNTRQGRALYAIGQVQPEKPSNPLAPLLKRLDRRIGDHSWAA